jgi:hypothetical protein
LGWCICNKVFSSSPALASSWAVVYPIEKGNTTYTSTCILVSKSSKVKSNWVGATKFDVQLSDLIAISTTFPLQASSHKTPNPHPKHQPFKESLGTCSNSKGGLPLEIQSKKLIIKISTSSLFNDILL